MKGSRRKFVFLYVQLKRVNANYERFCVRITVKVVDIDLIIIIIIRN